MQRTRNQHVSHARLVSSCGSSAPLMPGVRRLPMNTKLRDAEARHQNFIDEVNRTSTLWALAKGDGLAIWSDEEGFILPVWSDEQEREQRYSGFPDHEVRSYSLSGFEEVLDQLENKDVMIGTNLDASMGGIDISCAEFQRLLCSGDA